MGTGCANGGAIIIIVIHSLGGLAMRQSIRKQFGLRNRCNRRATPRLPRVCASCSTQYARDRMSAPYESNIANTWGETGATRTRARCFCFSLALRKAICATIFRRRVFVRSGCRHFQRYTPDVSYHFAMLRHEQRWSTARFGTKRGQASTCQFTVSSFWNRSNTISNNPSTPLWLLSCGSLAQQLRA